MEYKIIKGKPIPPVKMPVNRTGQNRKYPFKDMEPTDCFCVPMQRATKISRIVRYHNTRDDGKHFVVRTIGNDVWVWRER